MNSTPLIMELFFVMQKKLKVVQEKANAMNFMSLISYKFNIDKKAGMGYPYIAQNPNVRSCTILNLGLSISIQPMASFSL